MRTELSAQVAGREFGLMQAGREGLLISSSSVLHSVESLSGSVLLFDPPSGLMPFWVEPLFFDLDVVGEEYVNLRSGLWVWS